MELQYTKLAKSCISGLIDDAADNIKKLQRKLSNYKIVWEGPFNMNESFDKRKNNPNSLTKNGVKATGVYQVVYKPSKKIYYVGKGNLSDRRSKHKLVFENAGNQWWANGCKTDSQVARKMFQKDSDLSNWDFWYTRIPEADVMSVFEEALIRKMEPEFNDVSMAGKG